MPSLPETLSIGDVAKRSGIAPSALRFYEERGLLTSERSEGNQRRYARAALRRVAVIRAAQTFGLTLAEIGEAMATLPADRAPTKRDWERLSRQWRDQLDRRIADLQRLRDDVGDCIGCGCLSLQTCALFNADDRAAAHGPGARYLMGDTR